MCSAQLVLLRSLSASVLSACLDKPVPSAVPVFVLLVLLHGSLSLSSLVCTAALTALWVAIVSQRREADRRG